MAAWLMADRGRILVVFAHPLPDSL
jgi:NAD(P)H dehydrogenase (quinone)